MSPRPFTWRHWLIALGIPAVGAVFLLIALEWSF